MARLAVHRARLPWLCLLLLAAFPAPAAAGAWVPEPGHGYAKLWTKWLPGFGYHDGSGDTIDYGSYHELFFATYGEAGLVDGLAGVWQMDLVRAAWLQDPASSETSGHAVVGDPRLGARLRLLQAGRLAMAVEVTATAPLADDDPLQPFLYADGTPAGQLRLGAGVWDISASYAAGVGFDGFYGQAALGYVLRTDGFDDVLTFGLEGGLDLAEDLAARARVTGHLALEQADAPYVDNPAGVGNGVSYVGFALEADYQVATGWHAGLVFEGGLLHIRRQTGGPVLSLFAARSW